MGCSHHIAHFNTGLKAEEHLIGLLGRHHFLSGFRTYKKALSEITTDVTKQHPSAIDRPAYLDLYNQFGKGESYREFLRGTTLFGVYEPFIPDDIEVNGQTLLMPYQAYTQRYLNDWRYCSRCVEEDIEKGTMPYFRREHQLPTMTLCHKHQDRLLVLCKGCHQQDKELEKYSYPAGTTCKYCSCDLEPIDSFVNTDILWVQQSMLRLMRGEVEILPLSELKQIYQSQLGITQYCGGFTVSGRNMNQLAQRDFDNYFDPRVFRALFNNCDGNASLKRPPALNLHNVIFKEGVVFSPVVHLLIIRMLFGDIDNIPSVS